MDMDTAATTQPSANKDPDIDALFDGIDDLDEFRYLHSTSTRFRREADARNTRLVRAEISATIPTIQLSTTTSTTKSGDGQKGRVDGGDENEDGKKKRKPIARTGLPQLIKDTKNLKPKGKGHEAADLDRVLQVYQFWTHRLYPKTRFKETVDRVEKLCHSKRMQVALSVWRDEAKGLINGVRLPTQGNNNDEDSSDTDSDAAAPPPGDATAIVDDGGAADSGREGDDPALSSDGASRPPPSSPDRDEAITELDALLELEEEALHAAAHTAQTNHAWKKSQASGDDAAMDADDDLEAARQSKLVQNPPAAVDTHADDDLEDLYL
ncbi:replication fork protection component Swi3-domain-containing protein [Lactarius indigo]|nr:replication fork protection component Swi3-domain-containing protein [Lactarius indigo]